jgi:trehalose/maltose hydrolase-like predicted phosphorylase
MEVNPEGVLAFSPRLPKQWTRVTFTILWRGNPLRVTVTHDGVTVRSEGAPVSYLVDGRMHTTQESKG